MAFPILSCKDVLHIPHTGPFSALSQEDRDRKLEALAQPAEWPWPVGHDRFLFVQEERYRFRQC